MSRCPYYVSLWDYVCQMYFWFVIFVDICSGTSFLENIVNLEAKVVYMVRDKSIDLSRILHGCMHICDFFNNSILIVNHKNKCWIKRIANISVCRLFGGRQASCRLLKSWQPTWHLAWHCGPWSPDVVGAKRAYQLLEGWQVPIGLIGLSANKGQRLSRPLAGRINLLAS